MVRRHNTLAPLSCPLRTLPSAGLSEIKESYEVKCGLTGDRPSGLTREWTIECPTCEGGGYMSKDRHRLYMQGKIKKAPPPTKAQQAAPVPARAAMPTDGGDAYKRWKEQMDPDARAKFDAQIAEAVDAK